MLAAKVHFKNNKLVFRAQAYITFSTKFMYFFAMHCCGGFTFILLEACQSVEYIVYRSSVLTKRCASPNRLLDKHMQDALALGIFSKSEKYFHSFKN